MRPINLIPPEERSGQHAPLRTGPLVYIVIGALVLALAGVTALVLTGNQIADTKSEVATLRQEDAAAKAEAQRLAAYTQFHALHEERMATITSLADSRFDWERVMRELALVLPHDVWLTMMAASASPDSTSSSGSGGGLRDSIAGPALELSGCATGQEAVAGFVTALKEIEGVTRVGVESSELGDQEEGAGSTSASGSADTSQECRTRRFIAKFQLTIAFDAAPVPETESTVPVAPPSATEDAQTASTETSEGG